MSRTTMQNDLKFQSKIQFSIKFIAQLYLKLVGSFAPKQPTNINDFSHKN